MTDLVIRPLDAREEHLFDTLATPGLAAFGRTYRHHADAGEYRPEWTWVALRGDRVVARAAWWGGPADDSPTVLDWFDFTDPAAGTALLRATPLRHDHLLGLPPDWREQPPVRAEAQARIDAATAAGMRPALPDTVDKHTDCTYVVMRRTEEGSGGAQRVVGKRA